MSQKNSNWEAARKRGTDMSLLKANLEMTPTQRVRNHLNYMALAQTLRAAGERYYDQLKAIKEKSK